MIDKILNIINFYLFKSKSNKIENYLNLVID